MQLTGRFAHETVNRPASEFARLVRAEVLGRGHALRLLLTRSSADEPRLRARLAGLPARTAHVRFSAAPLPDLVSFDRELALVRSAPPDGRPQVLVTRYEATNVLHQFQQVLWDQAAEPPGPGGAARVPELDETQMQVLRMLASGMKDDTACRQMNVSVRTYRRHVATILKSLDVNTRFEAGLAAAELGLLGPRPVRRSAGHPDGRFMPSLLSEGAC
ncbi:response regulator transcription factor [Streptomyces sp. CO7]